MDNEIIKNQQEENNAVKDTGDANSGKINVPESRELTNIDDEPVTFEEPKEEVYIPLQHPDKNFPFYSNVDKRIYNNARALAIKILVRCERSDAYLDKIIDFELRQNDLNDKDKALLNEIAHGCIR